MWRRTFPSLTFAALLDASSVAARSATAQQFAGVRRVKVYFNGKPVSAYLSERD
jgi:hypothetical protein